METTCVNFKIFFDEIFHKIPLVIRAAAGMQDAISRAWFGSVFLNKNNISDHKGGEVELHDISGISPKPGSEHSKLPQTFTGGSFAQQQSM